MSRGDPLLQPYRVEPVDFHAALADLRAVRDEVFVGEQGVPIEIEHDALDPLCAHVVARLLDGTPIGTARLTPDRHIGRMAVRAPWRGRQPVLLRFHLHPAVAARPANGDTQIVLTLPNGKEWLFLADVPFILAETAHLANPEGPRRSTQIVTALPEGESSISWAFLPAEPG